MKTQKRYRNYTESFCVISVLSYMKLDWVVTMSKEIKKEESDMNAVMNIERPCTILESLEKSCQEVKLMRDGKIPKRSWSEFRKRIEEEMTEDN